jgi:DNA-binding IclR family transcriptional regulator
MTNAEKPATKGRARGLERAFEILDFLQQRGEAMRPIEIAAGMNAPKSSIYELTGLLLRLGILEKTDDEGRIFLGRKLHYLGLSYLNNFDLTRLAQPLLERITAETRETSQLCLLSGNKYTVVLMNEGIRQFRISANVGEALPIPWTASGRLLLGHMSDQEIIDLVPNQDFTLPDGTVLAKNAFIESVRTASRNGFFSFDSLSDSYTHCFAAPVYNAEDACVSTLCLIAPKDDAKANYDKYRHTLITAGADLTQSLLSGSVSPALISEE